jgi:hypothetical protein
MGINEKARTRLESDTGILNGIHWDKDRGLPNIPQGADLEAPPTSKLKPGAGFAELPNIPQGADLEHPPITEAKTGGGFTDAVFADLPDLLRGACDVLTEQTEKDVFLVGAFAVVSGILPNVRGFYGGEYTGCNLFAYILGQYGMGKGGLKFAGKLGRAVHAKRRELSAQLQSEYKQKCIQAKENKEDEPENPGHKMLFIPANNSKSGIVENLHDNDGAGIIFETEGDSLAEALKTDFGGFSDILRKSFHHEPISFYRRSGREFREIENPRLSVVLTSTYDQYQKLIPTIQNGLFSRFLHYRLSPCHDFKDVFDPQKRGYPEYFEGLGKTFLDIYEVLETFNEPLLFDLRESQKTHFLTVFDTWKKEVGEYVSTDLDGTVNRLGLICFRLAMLLTSLRNFGHADYSKNMLCEDIDFNNALRIVEILKRHAIAIFYDLPNPVISRESAAMEKEFQDKAGLVARCQRLQKEGKSYAEIAAIVLDDPKKKSKVYQWLNR